MFADGTACTAYRTNLTNFVNNYIKILGDGLCVNKMADGVSKINFLVFNTQGKKVDKYIHLIYDNE